ncbi:RluA family pseudouridine synthase [Niallia sp.]|uniref:RluA family pseudouridine synthase n=1 Tax=Niallia sp. TaxID=2837523 RepID=UPI0028A2531D|nr:RluA family pseudouridine synthase [Niallia sp.]
MSFTLEWVMQHAIGITIKEFLKTQSISKAALTDIKFKGGKILVNGKEENVRYSLKNGDRLVVLFPPELPSVGLIPERLPLDIIFEDEYILIVQKEYGMNTIPSREHPTGSLANALVSYYQEHGIKATTHIVTRLDRDTSGLVLIAKHRHIHHLLSEQQKAGDVKRKYIAFAEGEISPLSDTINDPIGRCSDSIIKREVREDGQTAITHYRVVAQHVPFSKLELSLETGRTHQIRVHLAYKGHPLLGDDLYGGKRNEMDRQALHCFFLKFTHPVTKQTMTFAIDLPEDMKKLEQEMKKS